LTLRRAQLRHDAIFGEAFACDGSMRLLSEQNKWGFMLGGFHP
jgi:hypothetical protein